MEFKILSHACLYVEHNGASVLIDPWLRGSAYWRSWWNFPAADESAVAALKPDYIYLSHLHWDHFHGPSLRALLRTPLRAPGHDCTILIPYDRYDRMARDLRRMGFTNVIELPHGKPFSVSGKNKKSDSGDRVADFRLTPYLFSPLGDSAVVISAGAGRNKTTLLNANDCKIIGGPLSQLLRDHPQIDFAFRSHSSANSRVLYDRLDVNRNAIQTETHKDDRAAYLQSFTNFMAAVRPRYAIPFASNHCHLHRETFRFNRWIVSPLEVRDFFANIRVEKNLSTELVVMLPGSAWSDTQGFLLTDTAPFENRDAALNDLAQLNEEKLQRYYQIEARVEITAAEIQTYFAQVFAHLSWFFRRQFRGQPITIKAFSGDVADGVSTCWRVDMFAQKISASTIEEWQQSSARIEVPAIVLRLAMRENMFGHVSISKRVKYQATGAAMPQLRLFELLLCLEESELIPLRRLVSVRALRSYWPRWRELLLYLRVAYLRFARHIPFQAIEQRLLLEMEVKMQMQMQLQVKTKDS